jgi:hypothetical protein
MMITWLNELVDVQIQCACIRLIQADKNLMAISTGPIQIGIKVRCHLTDPTHRAVKRKRVARLWIDVVNCLHDLGPKKTQVNPPLAGASWQTRCNSCRRVGLGLLHKYRCQAMQ